MADQLSNELKLRVEQATVRLPSQGGRGVLVPGGLILTAAHCLNYEGGVEVMRGSYHLELVETHAGSVKASPVFMELTNDVAVLAAPDDQEFFSEAEAYNQWREATLGVPIYKDDLPSQTPVPVAIFTQQGWIGGQVCVYSPWPSSTLVLESQGVIQPGDSGGPIVTLDGQLIGIVSLHGELSDVGKMPWLAQALPVWLLRLIQSEDS